VQELLGVLDELPELGRRQLLEDDSRHSAVLDVEAGLERHLRGADLEQALVRRGLLELALAAQQAVEEPHGGGG
jgi:hypothetical protein